MNGIKNYLVQHGETQLNDIIELERGKVGTLHNTFTMYS